ncbi:MAG: HlyD family secretion protein [Gammaproteobacteria bacterium]|nr:HlyD family secretion protein [Gammaproteobacteria bacterium]
MKFNLPTQMKKNILIGSIIALLVGSILWWLYGLFHVSTDDAYVNANVIQIASRVTGPVNQLNVVDNQYVKQGEKLFSIDPDVYAATFQRDRAAILEANAKQNIAKIIADRSVTLTQKNAMAIQDADIATSNLKSAIAQTSIATANAKISQLNLQYTNVLAPTNGWVTNMSLRVGDIVNANQPLFALVSDEQFWIDANFRETDLHRIKVGDTADIKVDMYPDHHFKGVVESIRSGSGTAFSLLPPENATGNWVKVTQRVPVRVRVLNPDPKHPLRIGTSATVTVKT